MNIDIYTDPIGRMLGDWSLNLNVYSILFRVLLAFSGAALIGYERARKRHSAGLKTFVLVTCGSTFAMLEDLYAREVFHSQFMVLSAAALIGIAMIGGNSYFYSSRNQIKGLTTAVALWACGFIGLAIGGGFYSAAAIGFAVLKLALLLLPPLEIFLKDRSNHFEIHLELKSKKSLKEFITTIRRLGLKIDDIEYNPAYINSGLSVFSISITILDKELKKYKTHREIIEALSTLDYVCFVEELV